MFSFPGLKKRNVCLRKPCLCQTRGHKKLDNGIASKNGSRIGLFGMFSSGWSEVFLQERTQIQSAQLFRSGWWCVIENRKTVTISGPEFIRDRTSCLHLFATQNARSNKKNAWSKWVQAESYLQTHWSKQAHQVEVQVIPRQKVLIIRRQLYDHHISPKIWKKKSQSCSSKVIREKKQPLGPRSYFSHHASFAARGTKSFNHHHRCKSAHLNSKARLKLVTVGWIDGSCEAAIFDGDLRMQKS